MAVKVAINGFGRIGRLAFRQMFGAEGYEEIPEDCSLDTATYSANGVKIGTYGVIGPVRMDYQKVVSVLEGVGKILEDMLTNKD